MNFMTNGLLIKVKYLRISSSYIRKPSIIYDFATDPIWISLYMRKILFLFYQCTDLKKNYECVSSVKEEKTTLFSYVYKKFGEE